MYPNMPGMPPAPTAPSQTPAVPVPPRPGVREALPGLIGLIAALVGGGRAGGAGFAQTWGQRLQEQEAQRQEALRDQALMAQRQAEQAAIAAQQRQQAKVKFLTDVQGQLADFKTKAQADQFLDFAQAAAAGVFPELAQGGLRRTVRWIAPSKVDKLREGLDAAAKNPMWKDRDVRGASFRADFDDDGVAETDVPIEEAVWQVPNSGYFVDSSGHLLQAPKPGGEADAAAAFETAKKRHFERTGRRYDDEPAEVQAALQADAHKIAASGKPQPMMSVFTGQYDAAGNPLLSMQPRAGAGTFPATPSLLDTREQKGSNYLMELAEQTLALGDSIRWRGLGGFGIGRLKGLAFQHTGIGSEDEEQLRTYLDTLLTESSFARGGKQLTPTERDLLQRFLSSVGSNWRAARVRLVAFITRFRERMNVMQGNVPQLSATDPVGSVRMFQGKKVRVLGRDATTGKIKAIEIKEPE